MIDKLDSPVDSIRIHTADGRTVSSSSNFLASGGMMKITVYGQPIQGVLRNVNGITVDDTGHPLANIRVDGSSGLYKTFNGGILTADSDSSGEFTFIEVPAGMKLHLYGENKDGTLAGACTYDIPEDPSHTLDVKLCLTPTSSASVSIINSSGAPVRNTQLECFPVVDNEVIYHNKKSLKTGLFGRMDVSGIIPGLEYHVRDTTYDKPSNWDGIRPFETTMVFIPAEN